MRSPHRVLARPLALLAAAATLALTTATLPAWAVPLTPYQVPFPCGETWTGSTRAGHSPSVKSVDFNRNPDLGAPVVAAAPGVVTTAYATSRGGYGRWVVVDHGNAESSLYAHLGSVTVAVGQRVDQGTMLGTVGDSGNSRGSHLHFEERSGRSVVDAWFGGAAYGYGAITSQNCVDVPLAANFVGDGRAEIAVFRRAKRSTFLVSQPGAAPISVRFGKAFDVPLLGDWNGDGQADVGVRTPRTSTLKLRLATGQVTRVRFGLPSDQPISGDWNGDGLTDVGLRRSSDATFWQRQPDGSTSPVWLGDADDLPVTGDWDGDRRTDLGVFDQATASFTLRTVTPEGLSVLEIRQFGAAGDLPVTGDWDGNGITDLGVWSPATAAFAQAIAARPTAARPVVRTVRFGRPRSSAVASSGAPLLTRLPG